ncbi:MAG: hypothetical protein WKF28_06220 [Rubrobacteraceae bacterium]|jgi:hypothetical protein
MSDLSFQLKMDRVACPGCGEELWIGAEVCLDCGAALQPGTESDAHLYKSRVTVFGPLLEGSRRPAPTSTVPVTDWQYLRYMRDTDLLDATPLSETARIASALKLETPSEIRDPENRAGTERLIRHADRYRRIVLDLGALRPSGRFDEVNPHLLAAFAAFLELIEELAATLVAWTPTEARAHASAMQAALDRASAELASTAEKMGEAFPESLVPDPPEERITSLVGDTRLPSGGELQTLGDLSSMGVGSFEQLMSRGPEGYKYFSDLLTVPFDDLPAEMPPALYMLSLLLNGLEDPIGIRRPASFFLDVLRDAYSAEPKLMLEAAVKVQKSLGEAGATLATLAPQVDALSKASGLSADVLRDFLISVYGKLTEGCFKHVTNLLLFGMFVSKGSPRTWEDISDWPTFGEKYQWLKDAGDEPAWVAALDGVETIVRNSDAHHEYELLDGGVRFIHRGPRKTVTEKIMDDEEFSELVRKIVRTVLSLSVAAQLFQCDHIREIASDLYSVETPRVLRPIYLELLLGIVGLLEPDIVAEGKELRVRAAATPYRPPSSIEEYLKGLFIIQNLYPEAEEASLEVESQGEWYCSLRAPAKSIDAVARKPVEAEMLRLLLTASMSSAGQPERSDEEKLSELGLSLGSRLVVLRLQEVVEALASPVPPPDLDAKLTHATDFLKDMEDALRTPLEVSTEVKRQRDSLIGAMTQMRRFFSLVLRVRRKRGDAGAIGRANKKYVQAQNHLERLVRELPPIERIF